LPLRAGQAFAANDIPGWALLIDIVNRVRKRTSFLPGIGNPHDFAGARVQITSEAGGFRPIQADMRTRGVFILNTGSDFRRRSAPKAFRTNNLWLRKFSQLEQHTRGFDEHEEAAGSPDHLSSLNFRVH
jgi:hypothetical protein